MTYFIIPSAGNQVSGSEVAEHHGHTIVSPQGFLKL